MPSGTYCAMFVVLVLNNLDPAPLLLDLSYQIREGHNTQTPSGKD